MSQPLPKAILQALDTHYESNRARWSRGAWAKDAKGRKLGENSIYTEAAYAHCLEAGVRIFARKLVIGTHAAERAAAQTVAALKKQIGDRFNSIPNFNDTTSYKRVRAVIKETIDAL